MDNIVALETRPAQINKAAVEMLRAYLSRAERGEIVGIAIAAVEQGGASHTESSGCDYFQTLLGALEILKFRMLANRTME